MYLFYEWETENWHPQRALHAIIHPLFHGHVYAQYTPVKWLDVNREPSHVGRHLRASHFTTAPLSQNI